MEDRSRCARRRWRPRAQRGVERRGPQRDRAQRLPRGHRGHDPHNTLTLIIRGPRRAGDTSTPAPVTAARPIRSRLRRQAEASQPSPLGRAVGPDHAPVHKPDPHHRSQLGADPHVGEHPLAISGADLRITHGRTGYDATLSDSCVYARTSDQGARNGHLGRVPSADITACQSIRL